MYTLNRFSQTDTHTNQFYREIERSYHFLDWNYSNFKNFKTPSDYTTRTRK